MRTRPAAAPVTLTEASVRLASAVVSLTDGLARLTEASVRLASAVVSLTDGVARLTEASVRLASARPTETSVGVGGVRNSV